MPKTARNKRIVVGAAGTGYPSTMPQASPKRAITLTIEDFSLCDRAILIAAVRGWMTMAIIGFKEKKPFVMSVGHPDGVSTQGERPEGMRAYALKRIRGLDKAAAAEE